MDLAMSARSLSDRGFRGLLTVVLVVIAVTVTAVLCLVGMFLLLTTPARRLRRAATPAVAVTNLPAFLAWQSKPKAAFRVEQEGVTYVILTGPSGQFGGDDAAYAFDQAGRLVGWTPDLQDYLPGPIGSGRRHWETLSLAAALTNIVLSR
jgi:hypothetical protein